MLRLYRIDPGGDPIYVAEREGTWRLVAGDIFGRFTEGPEISSDGLKIIAPVTPSKIVCVGLNFKDHAAEQKKPLPDEPILFHQAVDLARFFRSFFGANNVSPTREEYGMYMAKTASLRSLDLSRQIGAAIFTQKGEVITLGSNEVPRQGGGDLLGR